MNMKLHATPEAASSSGDIPKFLPKKCPYTGTLEEGRICGNWCPHFIFPKQGSTVKLTCGGQENVIMLED